MEDLNKNQLVLLTLFVSFVTSIATGIITVSLLQEAPPSVTQVINRVVEKTIEQAGTITNNDGTQSVREVTVVVKEEDQVIGAISKNTKSVLRITDNALSDGVNRFYGIGFLLNKDGLVVSAKRDFANGATSYTGKTSEGDSYQMKYLGSDAENKIAFFRIIKEENKPITIEPVSVGINQPQLGQTIITFDGEEKNVVSMGRVASIDSAPDSKDALLIRTDIKDVARVVGAPLFNLNGEVVGIRSSAGDEAQSFVPIMYVRKEISKYPLQ